MALDVVLTRITDATGIPSITFRVGDQTRAATAESFTLLAEMFLGVSGLIVEEGSLMGQQARLRLGTASQNFVFLEPLDPRDSLETIASAIRERFSQIRAWLRTVPRTETFAFKL